MRKALKIGVPVVVALIVIAGFAGWWFILRDDAPAAVGGVAEQFDNAAAASTPTSASASSSSGAATADGTWTVRPAPQVFAGYRINEELVGGTLTTTAVGRSPAVSGTLTIGGSSVQEAEIDVDMTKLASDSGTRDDRLRTGGIATDSFPTARFALTAPIDLGAVPQPGQVFDVTATGDLTLHGVTHEVSWPLEARWSGDTVDVTGSVEIVLADYGISMEAFAGFVKVAPRGTIEIALQFEPE
jgi:polyisoprenoid-binding protein YceI